MDVRAAFRSMDGDDTAYRGLPFWAWNDELDVEEVRRQVREMRRAGLGGHFMHARVGLVTPYMGEQWARCIKAAVDESKATGLKAWLYDEDCWPSGSAGGVVPAAGPEFQQKTLELETLPPRGFGPKSNTIATFLGVRRRDGMRELRRVEPAEAARAASARETLLHFYYAASTGYTDVLSAGAVRQFLRLTHERYRAWVGREFGKTVPGVFTDEPQYRLFPWSFDLPEFFRQAKGDDLLSLLPSLFLRYGDYRKARWQYFSAVTELFVRSYSRQLGEWCARHHLKLTGHVMGEDSLMAQIQHVGAAMPHYEHMQIPGVDQLLRRLPDPVPFKQVSSVAHQLDRLRVLSEMFGGAGWNVSLEEMKWLAEWQFALGINLPCQHLSPYSLRGCRKRDYPPALHCQQPWWDDYRMLNDLLARELAVLAHGKRVTDLLVIHPIESAYALYDRARRRDVEQLNTAFTQLSRHLLGIQRDYDYGDEILLARHGRVHGPRLRVGAAGYAVVLLPPMATIRSSTLRLLGRFMKRGGRVIRTGRLPLRVDGEPSKAAIRMLARADRTRATPEALRKVLDAVLPPRIELHPARGGTSAPIYVHQRDCGDVQVFFLVNTSRERGARATLRARGRGVLERWDAETGAVQPLPSRISGGFTAAPIDLPPMGSGLIALDTAPSKATPVERPGRMVGRMDLAPPWTLRRLDPNALTLDTCYWRADEGAWSGPVPLLDLQDHLMQVERRINLEMRFLVRSDLAPRPGRPLWLGLEAPGEYSMAVNGHNVRITDAGAWIDRAIRRVPLDGWNLQGDNEILLRRRFTGNPELRQRMHDPSVHPAERERMRYRTELESVYLIGEFAVRSQTPFTPGPRGCLRTPGPLGVSEESVSCDGASLTEDGLPCFAGRVELRQDIELPIDQLRKARTIRLELEPPNAIVAAAFVNGVPAGRRAWRPYHFDVQNLVKEGSNTIAIVLTGSLRNLLGPHHHADGEPYGVGPASFRRDRSWTDAADTPKAIWRDDYSFVRFGLGGAVRLAFCA